MFGPELIRINERVKKPRGAQFFIVAASAVEFWKRDISSASERAFPGFFGYIFGCSTPSKRCGSTQECTRFLSTVSSQCRAPHSDVSFQTR